MSAFLQLSRSVLLSLVAALETGRLNTPFSATSLANYVPNLLLEDILTELNKLAAMGAKSEHIAYMLKLLAQERSLSQQVSDRVDLVWTGPEIAGSQSRDTSVVVRELFAMAKSSILIASFAIDRGDKAQDLFGELAQRMDADSQLQVQMFLNVQRPYKSEVAVSILLREFADIFRQEIWPGQRLPKVFYDPRSLEVELSSRACLHAKSIVVDEEYTFITSANFTEAAHQRNIEAGVLLADSRVSRAIKMQFETLVTRRILHPVPGI